MQIEKTSLTEAIHEWSAVIGGGHVVCDAAVLDAASTATFLTQSRVWAILRPGTRAEIQACVGIANKYRIPIYPFSSGRNWGYGSRVPVRDGVLVDLGRMNRILDFSEELAFVTIEPGVTQRQLFAFLTERGSRLWMDATGASPDCSVIGNTLERGFGHTPMGDHCGNACGLEVVLPNGECIETGFARFPSSRVSALSRWGAGPSLDGLFSQSNFGIVTRMSVWLMPAPEYFQAFFFMSNRPDGLGPLVEALRPLRLDATLRSVVHIGNDYKVLTAQGQFPWHEADGVGPLDSRSVERKRRALGIGHWNGSGGLYGTRAQVREARRRLRQALRGAADRLQFVDDRLLGLMGRFAKPFRLFTGWDVSHTLRVIDPVYKLLKGVPTDAPLASAYWRKRSPPPTVADPDRDGCGLLWCSPVVPNIGAALLEVAGIASRTVMAHGFEPQMSVSLVGERSSICVITISYDRAQPGEDARALDCYRRLTAELIGRGYPPYRLNVESMTTLDSHVGYDQLLRSLKDTVDPNGILAPGRYQPGVGRAEESLRAGAVA